MTQTSGENILHPYRIAPGPRGNFLFGSARKIQRDPLQFGLTMTHQYGDIVRLRFLLWPAYLVNHPDSVKYVLQENQRNYNKDIYPYRVFQPLLGQGLVTNDGKSWFHQRHLMQPAFHRKRLAAFGTLMTGATAMMLDKWQGFAERDQSLDVAAEMLRLTLHIVSNFALMEMQLILATVAQRYRLRLVPGHQVEPEALLSQRPRYGLPMTLHHTCFPI
jgi:cytochrome P450